jgi:aminoglycoside phosphotransferase (APT) family kinase protein
MRAHLLYERAVAISTLHPRHYLKMQAGAVDPYALLADLGLSDASAVTPVGGGWDTALWRVQRGSASFALRVFRSDQTAQWRRELLVMQAATEHGLPVPWVHASTIWDGHPALLLSWCPGRPLLDQVRAEPWRVWALGVAMGRVHARIHAVPGPASLRAALPASLPQGAALLHLDYHPLNVMSSHRGITCVLDWANAAVGDPRADLARTVTVLRLAPAPPGTPATLLMALRRALELAWRTGYQVSGGSFRDMAPFYAWAGAMMEADLRPKLGRPGIWLRPSDLERIHRWTNRWNQRVGL